jgi:hypothetical protein
MTGMKKSAELVVERDRVVSMLRETTRTLHVTTTFPNSPGIYTVWAATERALTELDLPGASTEPSLMQRPLYVGKETKSIRRRLSKHFSSGDTGHSTLRRTLGSLLDLESRPRHTTIEYPTEKQLRTLVTNFDLTEADDDRLTRWMSTNIELCAVASSFTPLRDLERTIGAMLRPPLDQERSPMWQPNPWRAQVAAARRRLRDRASLEAESQR